MKTLSLCVLILSSSLFAKSAEDYLHDAAYKYIAERTQEASVAVEEGLREYPDDPKLQNLNDLLKQMKNQQRQDQNQSGGGKQNPKDQKDQKNKNDQNKNDQNKGDQKKDGQNKDQKKDQQDQNKGQNPKDKSGQDKGQQQPKPEDQKGQQPKDSSGQGGQARRMPGQMSKDEAERLLNSYVDEEKKAQQDKLGTPKKHVEPGQQDW